MVDQPNPRDFARDRPARMGMTEAIARAKSAMATITDAPIDAVVRCEKDADEIWTASVDVVDAAARMGDNDLLCTYEVRLDGQGEMVGFRRIGRYHREAAS